MRSKNLFVFLVCFSLAYWLIYYYADTLAPIFIFQPRSSEEITLSATHGMSTHEYFVSVGSDSLHVQVFQIHNPKGTILYCHGNKGGLNKWGPIARTYTNLGFDVYVWDYRGYGKSSGNAEINTIVSDGERILQSLPGSIKRPLVVFGRSLGTGVASYLSVHSLVDKIILESPYSSLGELIQSHVGIFGKNIKQDINSKLYTAHIKKPFLVIHGEKDQIISLLLAKKYYEGLSSPQKTWVEIPNGRHNNLGQYPIYWESLKAFL